MPSRKAAKISAACLLLFIATAGMTSCGGSPSPPPPPPPPPPPTTPDAKADALLAQMTQAEKLQMVQGGVTVPDGNYNYTIPRGAGGWVPGNTRLNIPALYLADGSAGACITAGPATP